MAAKRVPFAAWLAVSAVAGAAVLSVLSFFQKVMAGFPLHPGGFVVPVVYGGITGLLLGLWSHRLSARNHQLNELIMAREWLLRDFHHRIQNNLQIVSSMLALEEGRGRYASREETRLRIDLIGIIHRVLAELGAQYEVDVPRFFAAYLVEARMAICGTTGGIPPIRSSDRELVMPLDSVVVMAMIVNEVVAEWAARANCSIETAPTLSWSIDHRQSCLELRLPAAPVDDRDAEPVRERVRFRDELIGALAEQVSASVTLEWGREITCRLDVPLDHQRRYDRAAVAAHGAAGTRNDGVSAVGGSTR